jgi:hypothetical protein
MLINEVKATAIEINSSYILSADLGNFKKGEKITVKNIEPSGEDIVVTFSNDKNESDTFYLDKNDEI